MTDRGLPVGQHRKPLEDVRLSEVSWAAGFLTHPRQNRQIVLSCLCHVEAPPCQRSGWHVPHKQPPTLAVKG